MSFKEELRAEMRSLKAETKGAMTRAASSFGTEATKRIIFGVVQDTGTAVANKIVEIETDSGVTIETPSGFTPPSTYKQISGLPYIAAKKTKKWTVDQADAALEGRNKDLEQNSVALEAIIAGSEAPHEAVSKLSTNEMLHRVSIKLMAKTFHKKYQGAYEFNAYGLLLELQPLSFSRSLEEEVLKDRELVLRYGPNFKGG
jgi:hypothetical protein